MALTFSLPVSDQGMISMDGVKRLLLDQVPEYDLELLEIFPSLLNSLDVSFELSCVHWGEH
jgi:hypothetical protein